MNDVFCLSQLQLTWILHTIHELTLVDESGHLVSHVVVALSAQGLVEFEHAREETGMGKQVALIVI